MVAASSRGARFFVKNALLQGHSVTALCRAVDAEAALARMEELLAGTTLPEGGLTPAGTPGKLTASNNNIFKAETFKRLLTEEPSIDALCCFVGISDWKQMFKVHVFQEGHRKITKSSPSIWLLYTYLWFISFGKSIGT